MADLDPPGAGLGRPTGPDAGTDTTRAVVVSADVAPSGASPDAAPGAAPGAGDSTPGAVSTPGPRRATRAGRASGHGLFRRRRPIREPGKPSRAGRNLPAAIGVGAGLLIPVLVGLLFFPIVFVGIVTLFGAVGVWEICRALEIRRIHVPLVPTLAGALVLPSSAYFGGAEGLAAAAVFSVVGLFLWRSLDPAPDAGKSLMAGAFTVLWVPFMLSFAMLLMRAEGGFLVIATLLLLVVANDTFGYLIGAFFGKHAMAPKISPKKSWEGFGGSIGGAFVVGGLCAVFLLGQPLWIGLVLAVAIVASATAGDLAESMIKRELGVKDMSTILPGHGGVMDRLDSIVFASPMAYLLSATFVSGMM
ncbi:phosphatidate cytidylyltransferase [Arthrobacter burdickii]|uniref:Phosphatidate cytidylyltransferase n=1 Tax=Arthrobacter burdickii TaxID=3035920 RepID=A0ABT8K5G0_9MICC|nr:phosphatidate cytidylyltransferase [Arthrobacter burdickii]MDN4612693.1 phosphatidate cytidylyltransferase [Arthrobacter burdickii]